MRAPHLLVAYRGEVKDSLLVGQWWEWDHQLTYRILADILHATARASGSRSDLVTHFVKAKNKANEVGNSFVLVEDKTKGFVAEHKQWTRLSSDTCDPYESVGVGSSDQQVSVFDLKALVNECPIMNSLVLGRLKTFRLYGAHFEDPPLAVLGRSILQIWAMAGFDRRENFTYAAIPAASPKQIEAEFTAQGG